MNLIFKCEADNDLYRVLVQMGGRYARYDDLAEAVESAPAGAGVLALADGYPRASEGVDDGLLEAARAKGLRLYIEYPASLAGLEVGEPCPTEWERVVVSDDFFAPALERHTILALHGCWYLPVSAGGAQLVVARVAGYHRAVYGLPEETSPILFQHGPDVLVATCKLSQFVTARYGPTAAWKALWERLLGWLSGDSEGPELAWEPTVQLRAGKDEPLPDGAEEDALSRSTAWFRDNVIYSIGEKKGATEGYESGIDYEGRQLPRTWPRSDCIAETAMVFAYDWWLTRNPASRHLAGQVLDYVWSVPDFHHADPQSPAYGGRSWITCGRCPTFTTPIPKVPPMA